MRGSGQPRLFEAAGLARHPMGRSRRIRRFAPALRDGGRCDSHLSRDFIPGYFRFVPPGQDAQATVLRMKNVVRHIGAARIEALFG